MSDQFSDQDPIEFLSEESDSRSTQIRVRVNPPHDEGDDDLVHEYEERYYGEGSSTARKRQRAEWFAYDSESLRDSIFSTRSLAAHLDDDERLWGALAHISALMTVGVGIVTGGWAFMLMLFVPLLIYGVFRSRSRYVAFQALQAFALQLIGTVGWALITVLGTLIFAGLIIVSGLASIVLVGIPFLILFTLLLVVFWLVMAVVAFALNIVLPIIAALTVYNGGDFRYPFIARWVEDQLSGSVLKTMQ